MEMLAEVCQRRRNISKGHVMTKDPGVLFSIIGVDPDPFLLDNQRKMREVGCVIHVEMLKGVTCAVNCDV